MAEDSMTTNTVLFNVSIGLLHFNERSSRLVMDVPSDN